LHQPPNPRGGSTAGRAPAAFDQRPLEQKPTEQKPTCVGKSAVESRATVHVEINADEAVWVLARADGRYAFSATMDRTPRARWKA
jgi:hypothetical protein